MKSCLRQATYLPTIALYTDCVCGRRPSCRDCCSPVHHLPGNLAGSKERAHYSTQTAASRNTKIRATELCASSSFARFCGECCVGVEFLRFVAISGDLAMLDDETSVCSARPKECDIPSVFPPTRLNGERREE